MALPTWMSQREIYGTSLQWRDEWAESCYTAPAEPPKLQPPVTEFFPGLALTPMARVLKRIRQQKQRGRK